MTIVNKESLAQTIHNAVEWQNVPLERVITKLHHALDMSRETLHQIYREWLSGRESGNKSGLKNKSGTLADMAAKHRGTLE